MPSGPEAGKAPRHDSKAAGWIEVQMPSEDPGALEAVAALFDRLGRGGAVLEQPADGGPILVKTYLTTDQAAAAVRVEVEIGLALLQKVHPSLGEPAFRPMHRDDWAEAWKQGYHTQHIGRSLVVVPSWETYAPQPGQRTIHLDPGMAFGSGLHETTRLCMELLEAFLVPGSQVLDVGTGSGILAIAATLLEAGPVVALDTDPQAVEVAKENVRRNHAEEAIEVRWATVPGGEGGEWEAPVLGPEEAGAPFDLIVVNILADVAAGMIGAGLPRWLSPGGLLIVSGIILEQAGETGEAMQEMGLELLERRDSGAWTALVGQRGAAT